MIELKPVELGKSAALASIITVLTTYAFAQSIEGNWKTESGETAAITKCGGSYCIKLKTGKYSGKSIGKMEGAGNKYTGTITDPEDDKVYSGSINISGATMKMKGCALRIFCKTQTWNRL